MHLKSAWQSHADSQVIMILIPSSYHLMTQLAQSRKHKKGPSALRHIWLASTEMLIGQAQAVTWESGQLICFQAKPSLGLFSQGFRAAKHRESSSSIPQAAS